MSARPEAPVDYTRPALEGKRRILQPEELRTTNLPNDAFLLSGPSSNSGETVGPSLT